LSTLWHVTCQRTPRLYPGTTARISANGAGNGIVWTIEHNDPNDVLHAEDAANLANELYNSRQTGN
jgi:hypothetical protein